MDSSSRNNVKLLAAVIGGSAVVTMGALSMAIGQQQAEPPATVAAQGDDDRTDRHRLVEAADGRGDVDGRALDQGPGTAAEG